METGAAQQNAMAIDAETGETVSTIKNSLPEFEREVDQWFEDYIDGLSLDELDELSQKMFGVPLSKSFENKSETAPVVEQVEAEEPEGEQFIENARDAYIDAVNNGDMETAQKIIDQIAKKAGYTIRGTHRTNADFTVFDRSKQTGKNGKVLGDGFYVAAGEHTEYDNDTYGKNRMLVYINPGNVLDVQKGGLSEQEAKEVYDKYFAPFVSDAANADDSPYKAHVLTQLQKGYKVIDYIEEAAEKANTTTDVIFKELGYNSIKDGPQYCVFDSSQIKLADPITYNDKGYTIDPDNRFDKSNPDIRYSLPSDAPYLSAVNHGDMEEAQRMVDEKAEEAGYTKAGYHGTLSGGFTIFDKAKAGIGGNSGAGFYFSSNPDDSEANYSDVEGADNWFKTQHLVDKIYDIWRDSGEDSIEYEGYTIDEDTDIDQVAKEILTKNPQTYNVYLDQGRPYIRDFNRSTNLLEDAIDGFDESLYSREDYDNEDDYYDELSNARTDEIYQAISNAVYNGIADVDSNYEIISNVNYDDIINRLAEIRDIVGKDAFIISPGVGTQGGDPKETLRYSNALIIGRSIYNAEDPQKATEDIIDSIQ